MQKTMKKVDNGLKDINIEPANFYENAGSLKRAIFEENSKKSGIYRWVNEEIGESYVASGADLSKRLRSYYKKGELENSTRHINRALAKHGHDKFSFEILE